jgi:hypothetical protein
MAVCRIIETGATPEQYEQVRSKLGVDEGSPPPPGGLIHIAAKGEDGTIRIVEVWETREQAEQWGDKVRAVRQEMGAGDPTSPPITHFEAHRVLAVLEVPAANKPIEGVGTSVAAFVSLVQPEP